MKFFIIQKKKKKKKKIKKKKNYEIMIRMAILIKELF